MSEETLATDYQRIEQAILFIEQQAVTQPSLEQVAEHVGLSPTHFQRLFKRWAGVSPKRFLQYLTVEHAKQLLRDSASVLDTAFAVGLSSPGRLHDHFVSIEAVTPGEFKAMGRGLEISYGFHPTPFGTCLLATTPRGICFLGFLGEENRQRVLEELAQRWAGATLREDAAPGEVVIEQIFDERSAPGEPLRLLLKGTNFQLKVWEALLRIPPGTVTSYGTLSEAVGRPGASRAVGTAVGQNPVAYLIPCHRVLRGSGELGGYHWGTARKRAMLGRESAVKQSL